MKLNVLLYNSTANLAQCTLIAQSTFPRFGLSFGDTDAMTHILPFLWSALKAFFLCFGVATFFVLTGISITKHSRTGRATLKSIVSNE